LDAATLWARVTDDRSGFREAFFSLLDVNSVRFCVIDANAYVEPLISLDLDVAVAAEDGRLIEAYPHLREPVPAEVLERLV
jgi:hypothetical protein